MREPEPQRDPVEELAEEFLERQRRGETPSVEEYAAAHPDLAVEIRELFPTLMAMERLKARGERSSGGLASLGPVRLERLGDFRIIREVGRGGMGIVFEAQQESLGRRVALKVLPRQALLERRHLARFRREARIASRLHHTNIVQVYGVGEEEGFHYYVMQYVSGVGLEHVIARLRQGQGIESGGEASGPDEASPDANPVLDRACCLLVGRNDAAPPCRPLDQAEYYRRVAALAVQAAEALAYAHGQGAVHRDVKPSNLLLDEQGVVWLTDFGLAKADHAADVTQPGDLTGTLRYLPPERFRGQADERGDVYSLGLTLYELLTLRPAYDQADRSALIHQVSQGSPPSPRALNPAIPRDLETLVLKAISREPAHRYATAGALADDLRRFLEDRPLQARRIGPAERTWRWCRRNRAVAALAVTSLALLVSVAVVASVGYVQTRQALHGEAQQKEQARKAFQNEAREKQKSEAVAALAQEALDHMFDRLAPVQTLHVPQLNVEGSSDTTVEIPSQPVLSRETAALLEEMLPFYDRLAEQTGDDTALRQRVADANRRVGEIRQRLGLYEEAVHSYNQAITLYRQQAERTGGGFVWTVKMAETHNQLGQLYGATQRPDLARGAHLQALALLEPKDPTGSQPDPAIRYEQALTCYFLGRREPEDPTSQPPRPHPEPPAGQRPDRPGLDRPPRMGPAGGPPDGGPLVRPSARNDPATSQSARPPRLNQGPPPEAPSVRAERQAYLDSALSLLNTLTAESPANPKYRWLLALCYRDGARGPGSSARTETRKRLDLATVLLEKLCQDYPQVPEYRVDLCQTYALGDVHNPNLTKEELLGAESRLQNALGLSEKLLAEYPQVPEYSALQAHVYQKLGEVFRRTRRLDEAEFSYRKAVAIQAALAGQWGQVQSHQVWLAAYRNALTDMLLMRDRLPEARSLAEETTATLNNLLKGSPDLWYLHGLLADSYHALAETQRRSNQPTMADKTEQTANEHRKILQESRPGRTTPGSMTRPNQ